MSLVDYSDSESQTEDETATVKAPIYGSRKRQADVVELASVRSKPPPPLPNSFHSLYATNARISTSDDPSLHAGRTRQIPHAVGNWPTHTYLEWYPSQSQLAVLDEVISQPKQTSERSSTPLAIHSFLRSDLGAQLPLHISLSAPLVLKTEQKESFQNAVRSKLAHSHVEPFRLETTQLDWVANHDKSRYFLVLKLSRPTGDELNKLLSVCNSVAREYGLPRLYENECIRQDGAPSHPENEKQQAMTDRSHAFHISIAWTLQEPEECAPKDLVDTVNDRLRMLEVSFSHLKLKIGNAVIDIPFINS